MSLQAAVEADRRLAITVSKQLPHGLVLTRMVLEINRRRGVSKLMDRDPKSDRFLNARGDLLARTGVGALADRLRPGTARRHSLREAAPAGTPECIHR